MPAVEPVPNPNSTNFKYPSNLDSADGEYRHYIQFQAQKHRTAAGSPAPAGSVSLYMPGEALKTSYGQTFGDADLGALGNLVNQIEDPAKGAGVLAGIKAGSIKKTKAALSSALGDGFQDRVATAFMESTVKEAKDKLSGGMFAGATTALQNVIGKIVNPHKAVVYSGPGGFRTFSYTFVMTPENPAEAKTIADIVYFFKYHMHPGVDTVLGTPAVTGGPPNKQTQATQGSSTFTYPSEFLIRLFPNKQRVSDPTGSSKPPLFKIDKCYLENLTTDFSTSGQPAFFQNSGTPVTTTLGLTFKETVLVTRNTIAKGY